MFSLSVVSALAVCAHSACCKRGHILRGDKCLGTVNIAVSIIVIVTNTFMGGQEPWTNGIVEFKKPAKGFITHCSMLDQDHDATYPLLTQRYIFYKENYVNTSLIFHLFRCLLLDSTYILSIAVCLLWIILVLTTCMIKPNKRMFDSVPILPNEIEKSSWKLPPNHYNHSRKPKNAYTKKYATPIAPHIEKLELPGSYDHQSSNQLSRHQIDRYSMLSRQYPPPSTIPGAYVSPTNAAVPTIYYS